MTEAVGAALAAVLNRWSSMLLTGTVFTITTFGEDPSGELYVSQYGTAGAIYRIVWRDTDGDGMADNWEQQYFGSPTGAITNTDVDGDGFNNLQEFLAGTDPTNALSALRITSISRIGLDLVASYGVVASKRYEFQFTGSLATNNWTGIATNVALATGISQFTNTGAALFTNRFYRVRLLP